MSWWKESEGKTKGDRKVKNEENLGTRKGKRKYPMKAVQETKEEERGNKREQSDTRIRKKREAQMK